MLSFVSCVICFELLSHSVIISTMMMIDQVDCASASVPLKRVTRKVKAKNSCAKNKSRMWVARLVMVIVVLIMVVVDV